MMENPSFFFTCLYFNHACFRISVNGVVIFDSSNFNQNVSYLEAEITLNEGDNELAVELRGKPGGKIHLSVFQFGVPDPPRILGTNPGSAGPGALVNLNFQGDKNDLIVMIGGQSVMPNIISDNRLTFQLPYDLSGDVNLYLRAGDMVSNMLRFTVSDSVSVISPELEDLVIAECGTQVAVNLLMIFIADGYDLDLVANDAAIIEGGAVVGRIDPLRARQLRLPTASLDEIQAALDRLIARDDIKDATMEVVLKLDKDESYLIDWTLDLGLLGQRASNRVKEGADRYVENVHPIKYDHIRPYFRSIGVIESGVHFNLDDYSEYAAGPSRRSGGIALYAPDRGTSTSIESNHGSNVVGIIAAELGDGGGAGLLRSLAEFDGVSHGGFNIKVSGPSYIITGTAFMADIVNALKGGACIINISRGFHKKKIPFIDGALQADGSVIQNNTMLPRFFHYIRQNFDELVSFIESEYPNAILVVTAGNGNTNAGDRNWRVFTHPSPQVIVVGAHSNGYYWVGNDYFIDGNGEPVRDWKDYLRFIDEGVRTFYSNYGERVDIAAAGTVMASTGGAIGTSFAAPLVTATIAAMRSIEPDLTPVEVRNILRQTALPINDNRVILHNADGNKIGETVFVRALTAEEVGDTNPDYVGAGARLNVEGAILEAIKRRGERTRRTQDELVVRIDGDETVEKEVNVTIPAEGTVFDRVDIMFLVDVSGSYGSSINQFKTQAVDLVNAFEASGTDVHTGIASFSDIPISPWGGSSDYAFRLDQPLTGNGEDTINAINGLHLLWGADAPESQLIALHQLATGEGLTVSGYPQANIEPSKTGWREGSLRIIFLATDANFHNPEPGSSVYTPGYPGPSWSTTLEALNARNVRVYGLERGYAVADVRRIVEETDGEVFQLDYASSQIVEAVVAALEGAADLMDITLVPNGDFHGIINSIDPAQHPQVARGEEVTFNVTFTRGDIEGGHHVFVFRLEVVGTGKAVIEEIPVVVSIYN